ncbi:hypothetical protein BKI52_44530 [marine bacterium AO1-C]|nr:hypothetical protein BKI52_44530 [marine bacterium AO1-C]
MQFDKDLASPHHALFLEVRDYLLSFEGMQETKKTRITTYAHSTGNICHLRTMPNGVDLGFLKGSKMDDELQLLTGNGKAIRVLSLKSMNKATLQYYITQAIELNTNK